MLFSMPVLYNCCITPGKTTDSFTSMSFWLSRILVFYNWCVSVWSRMWPTNWCVTSRTNKPLPELNRANSDIFQDGYMRGIYFSSFSKPLSRFGMFREITCNKFQSFCLLAGRNSHQSWVSEKNIHVIFEPVCAKMNEQEGSFRQRH